MSKFKVGDRVAMPGVPITVEVLEIGVCDDGDGCVEETFRFKDPESGQDDWMHCADFGKVG